MLYITTNPDGSIAISTVIGDDSGGSKLAKTLFELSRTTDRSTHFDPALHTREAIAAGIDGHRPLALVGECDEDALPADRYFRGAWTWSE